MLNGSLHAPVVVITCRKPVNNLTQTGLAKQPPENHNIRSLLATDAQTVPEKGFSFFGLATRLTNEVRSGPKGAYMSDLLPNVLWLSFCLALWSSAARDAVTVAFCGAITLPYTLFVVLNHCKRRRWRSASSVS